MRILKSLTRSRRLPKAKSFAYEPRYYKAETDWLTPGDGPAGSGADKAPPGSSENGMPLRSDAPRSLSDKFAAHHADRSFYTRMQHQRTLSNTRFLIILLIVLVAVMWVAMRLLMT